MPRIIIHLPECEPGNHPGWAATTHAAATNAGGSMCPGTAYMADELYPDEPVWTEQLPDQPDPVAELAAALGDAKTQWGGDGALYDPVLRRLFTAAEQLLATLPPNASR